jgi:two-component system KDP operon response regulator KdpE
LRRGPEREQEPIKILLIEDNADIQEATRLIFDLHWPEATVMQAFDGASGIDMSMEHDPDLIILDLGLPDIDGIRVLKEIRGASNVPIIILTVRGEEMDKIRGLEIGADDYMVKPFHHRELLERIRAVACPRQRHLEIETDRAVSHPDLEIDLRAGLVKRGRRIEKLTNTELGLLNYLAAHGSRVQKDEDILASIWGDEYADCSEYLDAYVRRLREKIEVDPDHPRLLLREENGYRLVYDTN